MASDAFLIIMSLSKAEKRLLFFFGAGGIVKGTVFSSVVYATVMLEASSDE